MKKSAKPGTVSGVVGQSQKKYILAGAGVLLVVALTIGVWWLTQHESDKSKKLNDTQQRAEDTIEGQEQYLQAHSQLPDDVKALTAGNLAQSYAYIGECAKAHAAVKDMKSLATDKLKDTVERVEASVKATCK